MSSVWLTILVTESRADSEASGRGRILPAINVTVTLFADLRRYLPQGAGEPLRFALRPSATVADLLVALGIASDVELTAAVDGTLATRDTPLHDGADVMLLSPMEGGA